jgi:ankyrin repeat protein
MWAAGYSDDATAADGAATVGLLLATGARPDLADNRGRTALMIAAGRGHPEVVKLLLAAGADPKLRDKDGKTAADLATDDAVKTALLP